jgi:hypothetical protein
MDWKIERKLLVGPGGLTRSAAGLVAVLAPAFLLFGAALLLGTDSDREAEPFKLAFLAIWVIACIGIFVHALRVAFAKGRSSAVLEVEEEGPRDDFDSRLRKLERLRADGLVNEEEYHRKRGEILADKW